MKEPAVTKDLSSVSTLMTSNVTAGESAGIVTPAGNVVGLRWDHVSLMRELGAGAFNSVYDFEWKGDYSLSSTATTTCLEDDPELSPLALKCLNRTIVEDRSGMVQAKKAANDLRREASIMFDLPEHEHIVRLYAASADTFNTRGDPEDCFLILEKLQDQTMASFLLRQRNRRLLEDGFLASIAPRRYKSWFRNDAAESLERVKTLALPVAKGLCFLHRHNVIYRDLKPANIGFGSSDGQVRLFDFGLSRKAPPRNKSSHRMTVFVGTPRYMAPEVQDGPEYDYACDVYSFGLLLAEIYTLEPPHPQNRCRRLLSARPHHGIASREVRDLVRACLLKDHTRRPSMEMVVAALEAMEE